MLRVTAGHDIEYPLRGAGTAVGYYLQDGMEPPGVWAGKAAEALGLCLSDASSLMCRATGPPMLSYSDDEGHDFRVVVTACDLVGVTGIEPVASSVSGMPGGVSMSVMLGLAWVCLSVSVRQSRLLSLVVVTQFEPDPL